jgi:hypothetical protein
VGICREHRFSRRRVVLGRPIERATPARIDQGDNPFTDHDSAADRPEHIVVLR